MNKKGIIFALDGAIAISVVLIMLINTTYYFTTTSQESLSQSQVIKRGYDVVALYQEAGRLDQALGGISPGEPFVPETGVNGLLVSDYLPSGYDMTVELYDAVKTECFSPCEIFGTGLRQYVLITPLDLIDGGNLFVQANVGFEALTSSDPSLSIVYDGVPYPMTAVCDVGETCTYTTKDPVLNFPVGDPQGRNLRVYTDNGDEFIVNWIRILDDPAYMLQTDRDVPRDRFIGSGERWYAAFDSNGHFEGMHKVMFKIWIEGETN